jgi:hypothetical protein
MDNRQQFSPAPWQLCGDAILAFKPVRTELARPLVPTDARIVSVWPGRTIAMLYLARYRQSPVGEYGEVIVAPAIVRLQGRIGAWISHILVDSEASMIAGRTIWALPKQLASIQWHAASQAQIRVDAPLLKLHAEFSPPRRYMPLPFMGAALTRRGRIANTFVASGVARVGTTRATIELSAAPELERLGLHGSRRIYVFRAANIRIGPPRSNEMPHLP